MKNYISRAPTDCAQWITGASGSIISYNWAKAEQISGNIYTYCVRREKGYCSIIYQPATGETIDTFQLDDIATSINVSHIKRLISSIAIDLIPFLDCSHWN